MDNMKIQNLRIIGIKREEFHFKIIENIFNKISSLGKDMPIQMLKTFRNQTNAEKNLCFATF